MTKQFDNITKARSRLVIDHPFFASLLLGMELKEDKSIPTFATDGDSVIYNPEFSESLSLQELIFVLAHETMHCAFQHMFRRGKRDFARWNIAADYIINDVLVEDKVGEMPKMGLYDPALVKKGKGTTEGVYDLLPNNAGKGKKPGQPGMSIDECRDASGDAADMQAKEADMKVKITQAANAAKMSGKLSSGVERLVKAATKSKVNWRDALRRFVSERDKVDSSYARPKRRFLADDIMLPTLTGERVGSIVIAVDCSGSISDELLKEFSVEMQGIKQDVMPSELHVLYFDSEICKHDVFGVDDELIIKPKGGGGTAFSPIFKFIEKNDINAKCCIVFTDLECSDYGKAPEYSVMFIGPIRDGSETPFGEVVMLR